MRAVILAGGKGIRLRPYTVVLPKPLMPIGEYPILEVVVRQLAHYGFNHITLAVNHQAEIFQAFFGSGDKWGIKIDYSIEERPLSTIGPLKLMGELPEDFLVMNGDILTDMNFKKFFDYHVERKNIFSVSSHLREQIIDYGVLETDSTDRLCGFREKPKLNYDVSMGVYMANRRVLDYIPEGVAYGFDNLMLDLIKDKNPACVWHFRGYWLDIGRPEDYAQAVDEYEALKGKFLK